MNFLIIINIKECWNMKLFEGVAEIAEILINSWKYYQQKSYLLFVGIKSKIETEKEIY